MSVLVASPIQRGWAFDTSGKFSEASAASLFAAPYPGQPKVAVCRYVSLGAPRFASDISPAEIDAILAVWPAFWLVQHVQLPSWKSSPTTGHDHGAAAAEHADAVGYPMGAHIGLDMEGCADVDAHTYIEQWCLQVSSYGFLPMPYDGYADAMPADVKRALVDDGYVRATDWWSDYGPRQLPPGLAWAVKQHAQTTLGGVVVDPDEVLVDNVLIGAGLPQAAPDGPDPHIPVHSNTNVCTAP